jgi:hypothetical protein
MYRVTKVAQVTDVAVDRTDAKAKRFGDHSPRIGQCDRRSTALPLHEVNGNPYRFPSAEMI